MLLAIDIGNTHIVVGLFEGRNLKNHWRIATQPHRTSDEYAMLILSLFRAAQMDPSAVDAIICSSVVPPLTPIFSRLGEKYFQTLPLLVTHEMDTGLKLCVDNPQELGADRIVNAAAGYALYGGPLIIVDFGTATTLCAVSRKGEYLGGAIAPGLLISTEALFSRTAKLPEIELARPKTVIGKNTTHSMQSGIVLGFACLIDGLIEKMTQEMASRPKVIATGGLASILVPASKTLQEVRPHLTLEGLRILYDRF